MYCRSIEAGEFKIKADTSYHPVRKQIDNRGTWSLLYTTSGILPYLRHVDMPTKRSTKNPAQKIQKHPNQ